MELAEGSAQARSWLLEGSLRLSALRKERPTQVDRPLRRRLILLNGFAQATLARAAGDGDVVWRVMRLGRSTIAVVLADRRRWQRPRTSAPSESCAKTARWKALGRRTSLDVDATRKSKASWPRRHRKVEPWRQRVSKSRSLDLVASLNQAATRERTPKEEPLQRPFGQGSKASASEAASVRRVRPNHGGRGAEQTGSKLGGRRQPHR